MIEDVADKALNQGAARWKFSPENNDNRDEVRVVQGYDAVRTDLANTLRWLTEQGGSHNFVILEVNDEKNYYVQFSASCGGAVIQGEAVSERYVLAPLSPAQRAGLLGLGWRRPTVRKWPNYYRFWTVLTDRERLAVADVALETLQQVYGWQQDSAARIIVHMNW
jgi:type III secretion system-like peptide-binding chaperone